MLRCVVLVRTDFSEENRLHRQGEKNWRARNNVRCVLRLPVTANAVPSSPILITLMMEAIRSSETSVLRKGTRCMRASVASYS
jgi:hypothetical protein